MADRLLNYEKLKKLSDEKIYAILCRLYPDLDLYCVSVDWRKNREYILKAKGGRGDVIIGWK